MASLPQKALRVFKEEGWSGVSKRLVHYTVSNRVYKFFFPYHLADGYDAHFFSENLADSRPMAEYLAPKIVEVFGFEHEKISETIGDYLGIKRRFEKLGTVAGVAIIDDYAHHPTAVRETLQAARLRYPYQEPNRARIYVEQIKRYVRRVYTTVIRAFS
jgi:hypothetical protein